jgi:hypothetical protein
MTLGPMRYECIRPTMPAFIRGHTNMQSFLEGEP